MITKKSRILVTGGNGALGEAVCNLFAGRCVLFPTDVATDGFSGTKLDISSFSEVHAVCAAAQPTVIINLAAMTDLEECEHNPARAYETNMWGVHYLLSEARTRNIPFVHISTAGVFDGIKKSYAENDADEANPLSVYGKSKYGGELLARKYAKAIVLRSGWMIGGGPLKDKKFVGKIIAQVRAGAREIVVVHDKSGTPSYTYDIARLMLHLLQTSQYGLYHACCDGSGSRADVLEYMLDAFCMRGKVVVRTVASDHFKRDYFAPRPQSEIITNARARAALPGHNRHFKDCIAEYAKKFDWNLPFV